MQIASRLVGFDLLILKPCPTHSPFVSGQINVENPCTVMSQDKVKQFLHTGSATDRYKVGRNVAFADSKCSYMYSVSQRVHTHRRRETHLLTDRVN